VKTFEAKTTINAPTQMVLDYVSDFTKHGEWAGRQPHGFPEGHDASSLGPSPPPRFLNQIGRGEA
jgi:hypothetical protein